MTDEIQPSGKYLWLCLGVSTGAQVGTAFVTLGVASLIPFLVTALRLTATQAGLAGGAANVGMMAMALPAGRMADRYGEKRVLVWGCFLTGLSIMLSSLSGSFGQFYPLLLFTGLWASSITPAGSKLIVSWFPARRLGLAQSVRQTGVTLGGLLAALVLPSLALRADWRAALLAAGLVAMAGAASVKLFYRERRDSRYAPGREGGGSLAEILGNRNIWLASCMGMCFLGAQFVLLSYLQLFLHVTVGMPVAKTSLFLAVLITAGLAGRILWGLVSDLVFRGSRRPVLVLAGLMATVASLGMLLVGRNTPHLVIGVLTFFLGFSAIGWNGVNVALFAELGGGRQEAATAVGVGISAIQAGVLCVPPLFGYLVDVTGTYGPSWVLLAVSLLLGVFFATLVREKEKQALQ